MDRRLSKPRGSRERREAKTSFLDRPQRQCDPETREYSRPREVRQGEYRVEGGELGHAPVERVRSVAKQDGVAERLDHVAHSAPDGDEEEGEASSRAVFDELRDEQPCGSHQPEGGGDSRKMEDRDQREVKQR